MLPTKDVVLKNVKELVSLPDIYIKVRELLNDDASSIDDFAEVINYDPSLVIKILRIANSAFFGFATKIDNISRAISIMGTGQLHDLVLATSVVETFKEIPDNIENMNTFWRKSVYTGVIAQLIASKCNSLDSERFFVMGLLHNIGHLVLCTQLPKEMTMYIEQSCTEDKTLASLEKSNIGFDYSEIGGDLLKAWELPEAFVYPIRNQLLPEKAEIFHLEASALNIANILAMDKDIGQNSKQTRPIFSQSALQLTGLTTEDLSLLQSEGDRHFDEALALLT
jgi:HD-like signal output (HDOD) protein